ncbi:DNA polymerase I [Pendulispora albinea]|uniref:DNA polymerase I n=1 Tax=Pendulispora albinea TaxID=2741071 RepID=A0ABZ2M2K4_9BACT
MAIASAVLPPSAAPGVLYLIDLSGYVFRAYHAIAPLSSSKGEPTHAVMGTVNMLQKVVNDRRPEMLAVAMDSRGPNFRRDIDARYKSHRPAPPPDLSTQMARCEAIVKAYNIPIYQAEGIEADDLIACVVARARTSGMRVVIVSADKDLMQLVDDEKDDVVLWDSMRDKVYGPAEVRTKFGVPPSQVRDLLALTGDTSDNIPGVPSVGPKTAADLLTEFGTLEGIYAGLSTIKKNKLREALTKHEEDARVSQKLVTLRSDCEIAWDPAHLRYGGADNAALRELFLDLEFHRLLDQLQVAVAVERNYQSVLDPAGLAKVLDAVRAKKRLGFDLILSDPDPMRAAIVGVALSSEPGDGHYVPISHRYLGAPPQLTWETVKEAMAPLFADPAIVKTSHHLKLAHLVLARHGIRVEGAAFDTMLGAYLLDPDAPGSLRELARKTLGIELAVYGEKKPATGAAGAGTSTAKGKGAPVPFDNLPIDEATPFAAAEAEVCVTLASRYAPSLEREGLSSLFHEVELPLARVLADMERAGVLLDASVLEALGKRVEVELRNLEAQAKEIAKADFSVRSRDQLEKILFDELKLPVLKRTPKGGRSTDAEVLEELAEKHPLPKVVVEFREIDKLKGTYIDTLPRAINKSTGRIHTRFHQTVAATGRLASSDPNLQNIPIRTELGREIRAAFVAPPGHLIVSADYSQIELRVLAHLSEDPELIAAFSSTKEDVHTHTASLVFDVPRDQVTAEMRRRAKTINFGVIYGMGDSALARQLDITRAEAASFIEAYFRRYAGVARFMEETIAAAGKGEAVRTLLGRRRFLPNLHSANRGLRMEAERVAKNTPIQGTAADILKLAMVKLGTKPVAPGATMILTVHDELVFEVPEAHVGEAMRRIREEMEGAITLRVPLVVDIGSGKNWNEAH